MATLHCNIVITRCIRRAVILVFITYVRTLVSKLNFSPKCFTPAVTMNFVAVNVGEWV